MSRHYYSAISDTLPLRVYKFAYKHKLCVRRRLNGHYVIIDPQTREILDYTSSFDFPTERAAVEMCQRYLKFGPRCGRGFRAWIRQLMRVSK